VEADTRGHDGPGGEGAMSDTYEVSGVDDGKRYWVFTWMTRPGPKNPVIGAARCGARVIVELRAEAEGTHIRADMVPREPTPSEPAKGVTFGLGPVLNDQLSDALRAVDKILRGALFKMHNGRDAEADELADWCQHPKRAWTAKKAEKYWRRYHRAGTPA
jgi:hypothetical protein